MAESSCCECNGKKTGERTDARHPLCLGQECMLVGTTGCHDQNGVNVRKVKDLEFKLVDRF